MVCPLLFVPYYYPEAPVPDEIVDEPTTELDFSKTPLLQKTYMLNDSQHNIATAIGKLRGSIKGFWVEMPLEWGAGEKKSPNPPGNSPQTIASTNSSSTKEMA